MTNGFTLTGILVGGQKAVNWDFTTGSGNDIYTIYDKTAGEGLDVSTSAESGTNYTLVLETLAGDDNGTVRVALELVNKGSDFAGANGEIIPAGGRFYIVGELKPTLGTTYDANTKGKDRVFTQDHKTMVTFTINKGSSNPNDPDYRKGLGTATNGLPDLRSSSMELGLSVNLEWQLGLTFSVNI